MASRRNVGQANTKQESVSNIGRTDLPESRLRKANLWALRTDELARAEDDGVVVAELGKSYLSQALAPGVQEVGLGVGAGGLGLVSRLCGGKYGATHGEVDDALRMALDAGFAGGVDDIPAWISVLVREEGREMLTRGLSSRTSLRYRRSCASYPGYWIVSRRATPPFTCKRT